MFCWTVQQLQTLQGESGRDAPSTCHINTLPVVFVAAGGTVASFSVQKNYERGDVTCFLVCSLSGLTELFSSRRSDNHVTDILISIRKHFRKYGKAASLSSYCLYCACVMLLCGWRYSEEHVGMKLVVYRK